MDVHCCIIVLSFKLIGINMFRKLSPQQKFIRHEARIRAQISTIESRSSKRSSAPTSHIFHLLMSVITAGVWIPVWILMIMRNSVRHDLTSSIQGLSDRREMRRLQEEMIKIEMQKEYLQRIPTVTQRVS